MLRFLVMSSLPQPKLPRCFFKCYKQYLPLALCQGETARPQLQVCFLEYPLDALVLDI